MYNLATTSAEKKKRKNLANEPAHATEWAKSASYRVVLLTRTSYILVYSCRVCGTTGTFDTDLNYRDCTGTRALVPCRTCADVVVRCRFTWRWTKLKTPVSLAGGCLHCCRRRRRRRRRLYRRKRFIPSTIIFSRLARTLFFALFFFVSLVFFVRVFSAGNTRVLSAKFFFHPFCLISFSLVISCDGACLYKSIN